MGRLSEALTATVVGFAGGLFLLYQLAPGGSTPGWFDSWWWVVLLALGLVVAIALGAFKRRRGAKLTRADAVMFVVDVALGSVAALAGLIVAAI
jgi:ABC-type antimicrobial peptide transport system permease subunit